MNEHQITHQRAVVIASKRRMVERFEQVGTKVVRVTYRLVHSNNIKALAKAKHGHRISKRKTGDTNRETQVRLTLHGLRVISDGGD